MKISLNSIIKIPHLNFQKSVLNVFNINIDFINKDYTSVCEIKNIVYLQNLIFERTENEMIINLFFKDEVIKNILMKNDIREIENLACILYSKSLLTKFNTAKQLFVSFPQIFNRDIDTKKFLNFECNFMLDNCIQENSINFTKDHKNLDNLNMNFDLDIFGHNNIYHDNEVNLNDINFSYNKFYEPLQFFKFKKVALGGSYDHLHIGHNLLLTTAALSSNDTFFIGITSQEMLRKKDDESSLQPYCIRENNVRNALYKIGFNKNIQFKRIIDSIGGTGTDKTIDALVLTEETINGGEVINKIRNENQLEPLNLICSRIINQSEVINNEDDFGDKISSRKIRKEMKRSCPHLNELMNVWNFFIEEKLNIKITDDFNCYNFNEMNYFSFYRDLYSQPWRAYHNLNHVYELIHLYDMNRHLISDEISIISAIWFHDIIYNPSRKDNEERSLKLFSQFYEMNKNNIENIINFDKVKEYILRTKFHTEYQIDIKNDKDLQLFLDMDMSILGQHEIRYTEYIKQIRKENFIYSEIQFNSGRKKYIEKILERKTIYYTNEFILSYEELARKNLNSELNYINKL